MNNLSSYRVRYFAMGNLTWNQVSGMNNLDSRSHNIVSFFLVHLYQKRRKCESFESCARFLFVYRASIQLIVNHVNCDIDLGSCNKISDKCKNIHIRYTFSEFFFEVHWKKIKNIFKIFGGHKSSLCGHKYHCFELWWSLLWVSKLEWLALFITWWKCICYT